MKERLTSLTATVTDSQKAHRTSAVELAHSLAWAGTLCCCEC